MGSYSVIASVAFSREGEARGGKQTRKFAKQQWLFIAHSQAHSRFESFTSLTNVTLQQRKMRGRQQRVHNPYEFGRLWIVSQETKSLRWSRFVIASAAFSREGEARGGKQTRKFAVYSRAARETVFWIATAFGLAMTRNANA